MDMVITLINWLWPSVKTFNAALTERLHMKFDENWPRGFSEKIVQGQIDN